MLWPDSTMPFRVQEGLFRPLPLVRNLVCLLFRHSSIAFGGVWLPPQSQATTSDNYMLWAAALLGFFGFLRSGEFTIPSHNTFDPQCHLTPSDIAVDKYEDPSYMSVHIKQSKTDPFRMGITLYIGRNKSDSCPVNAMLHYLVLRGNHPGPLFRFASGAPLTHACLVNRL